jgi:hypothetical protein
MLNMFQQPILNPADQALMQHIQQTDENRLRRMRLATAAYYGNLPPSLRAKPQKPNDSVQVNLARLFVNKGVSFLFGKEVSFEIDESKDTEEEKHLKLVWTRNKKMTLLHNAGVNGGIYGHVFIRIVAPEPPRQVPRLILCDTMDCDVKWAEDDIEEIEQLTITGPTVDKNGKPVTQRRRIEKDGQVWIEVLEQKAGDDKEWRIISETPWPYPFPPFVHCQNLPAPNEFWGIADLELDWVELLKSMNFTVSSIRKIVRYHGHPRSFASGITPKQLINDTDETTLLPNENAKVWNLEPSQQLGSIMEYYKILKELLHATGQVPEVALGNLESVGAVSGVALELLFQPLLDKTDTKRLMYGEMLETLCARLLVMNNMRQSEDDVDVKTTWPQVLPKDGTAERANALSDLQLGVASISAISKRLDLDFETQQKLRAEEKAKGITSPAIAAMTPQQPAPGGPQAEPPNQKPAVADEKPNANT